MTSSAPWLLSQVQVIAEAMATIAFALSGVIEGARKRLDAVGICVVGGLAAFGSGTVRDVLLDRRPPFWIEHAGWIWVLLALCIGASAATAALWRGSSATAQTPVPSKFAQGWPGCLIATSQTAGSTSCRRCQGAAAGPLERPAQRHDPGVLS
jgi:Glycine transporter